MRGAGAPGTLDPVTTDSPLRQRLRILLLDARRSRDAAALPVIRSALAALENAEAVPTTAVAGAIEGSPVGVGAAEAKRRTLTEAEEQAILATEIEALAEAESMYAARSPERARAARAGIVLLDGLRGTVS